MPAVEIIEDRQAGEERRKPQSPHEEIIQRLDDISAKVDPMYEIFTSVTGFNKIAVWIVKILAGIGVLLTALYALAKLFRDVAK